MLDPDTHTITVTTTRTAAAAAATAATTITHIDIDGTEKITPGTPSEGKPPKSVEVTFVLI